MSKNKNVNLPKHVIKIYKLIKNQKHEKHAVIYFDIYLFIFNYIYLTLFISYDIYYFNLIKINIIKKLKF